VSTIQPAPGLNPAASSAKACPLRRWTRTSRACCPQFSLRPVPADHLAAQGLGEVIR
jgi:hypothetical protein